MSFSAQEIEEFKAEALELLDVAEKSLLSLDKGAEFRPSFDAIFRGFHNLKGAAGMMELRPLQAHTHELENILMGFKNENSIPKEYVDLFLRGIDTARSLLDGKTIEFSFEVNKKIDLTQSLTPPKEFIKIDIPLAPLELTPQSAVEEFFAEAEEIIERVSKNLQTIENGQGTKELMDSLYRDVHSLKGASFLFSYTKLGELAHGMESSLEKLRNGTHIPSKNLLNGLFKSLEVIEVLIKKLKQGETGEDLSAAIPIILKALSSAADKLEALETSPPPGPSPKENKESEGASSIRVPISLLDNLMTLVGEMVLVRNQVLQFSNKSENHEFLSMSKRLNVVTSEIQGEMMKTRMQPIGNVLTKFNRVVRDLSLELNKSITFNLSGSETELDKSLLEAIKDPLTHIVRNSCDHGIETPEIRRSLGKSDTGTLTIKAYHEGGQVVIEINDDGKGLNKEILLKKAIEKKLISQTQAEKLSEKEIFNLIFAPGFSTAAKVTNVSGRGVGMDVVRTNIERIGGTVDLSSVSGSGTSIKIKIPLTLAIIPALIVTSGGNTFAIPQIKLEQLIRIDTTSSSPENKIEMLHGIPVYRLRNTILPLVDLNKVLKTKKEAPQCESRKVFNIAILNAEHSSFGLIIDQVQDTADIVVKPLNLLLKSLQVYSGATILGDGSIALILDVHGIAKIAQIGHEKNKRINEPSAEELKKFRDVQDYLLVKVHSSSKHAIVLGYVHRLEEFKRSSVEYSGLQPVIRYRDIILPLISADEQLGYPGQNHQDEILPVVVIKRGDSLYGIHVEKILDTLSTAVELDNPIKKQPGIFGNLNTPEELVVVIDPYEMISQALPDSNEGRGYTVHRSSRELLAPTPSSPDSISQHARILLAEDTVFFRKAIKSVLEKKGYEVVTAQDGKEAIEILNRSEHPFDLIISDIEMPEVNGFQLAESVRRHPSLGSIPLMAVSSRSDSQYISQGKKVGFDVYLEKLKPSLLLEAVENLISKHRSAA